MKKISILLSVIILLLSAYKFMFEPFYFCYNNPISTEKYTDPYEEKEQSIYLMQNFLENEMSGELNSSEIKLITDKLNDYSAKITVEQNKINSSIALRMNTNEYNSPAVSPLTLLIIKFIFSLMFGGSALYVILSQKYNEETQKWAFSILTLISGVWIGTVS